MSVNDQLRAENEKLRTALEPFVNALTQAEKDNPGDLSAVLLQIREAVTLYEFGSARKALEDWAK